jgi:RNA 2',3'-cyclic 3'-phosphodiesterase
VRLFVAIEVGSDPGSPAGAPDHLTLSFLGEVGSEFVDRISSALTRAASETPPFDLVLEGVGAFPTPARPRVVWVGATTGGPQASALAARVSAALAHEGFPVERGPFVPHVTLFRVRSPELHRRARALLTGAEAPPPARKLRISEILLKESTLTARGAIHRTIAVFPLGGSTERSA